MEAAGNTVFGQSPSGPSEVCQTRAVDTIPLADGDVGWVFPELDDAGEVLDLLRRADSEIRLLADHLRVRASWTGSGIEFHRLEWGQASLFGCAETDDVSFIVELWVPNCCARDLRAGPPWEVEGGDLGALRRIGRLWDALDRGGGSSAVRHTVGRGAGIAGCGHMLRQRGVAESPRSWRPRDPRRGHT